ncbi:NADAR domain-containing protein, variant 4 [Balamuthia mandrillaris]
MKTYMRQEVEKAMIRVYGGRKAWKAAVLKAQSKSASSSASSSSSASTPAMKEVNPQPKEVSFYSSKDRPYGCFSNSSAHPITLHDKEWPTVEHYLQAQKFAGLPMEEQIRGAISAKEAKSLGSTKEIPKRRDWDRVKDNVLYEAVLAKCRQHKDVSRLLLSTGNAPIHYCSPDGLFHFASCSFSFLLFLILCLVLPHRPQMLIGEMQAMGLEEISWAKRWR